MNPQVASLIRTAAVLIAGWLVHKGFVDSTLSPYVIGFLIALGALLWSQLNARNHAALIKLQDFGFMPDADPAATLRGAVAPFSERRSESAATTLPPAGQATGPVNTTPVSGGGTSSGSATLRTILGIAFVALCALILTGCATPAIVAANPGTSTTIAGLAGLGAGSSISSTNHPVLTWIESKLPSWLGGVKLPAKITPAEIATVEKIAGPIIAQKFGQIAADAFAKALNEILANSTNGPSNVSTNGPAEAGTPNVGPLTLVWNKPHNFCGCPYFWSSLDPESFCANAVASGFDGIGFELLEEIISLKAGESLAGVQAAQITKLIPWTAAARKYGLIVFIDALNSNDALGPMMTPALARARIDGILSALGTENILLEPCSEDDAQTSPAVCAEIRSYAAQKWPASQRADYSGHSTGAAFLETHPCNFMNPVGNGESKRWSTLVVSDCGGTLYNGAASVHFAQEQLAAGCSVFATYGFENSPDWKNWALINPVVSQPAVPVVESADAVSLAKIKSAEGDPNTMAIMGTVRIVRVAANGITVHSELPAAWNEGPGTIAKCMIAVQRSGSQIGTAHYWEWLASAANHNDSFRAIDSAEASYLQLQSGDTLIVWEQSGKQRTPDVVGVWP